MSNDIPLDKVELLSAILEGLLYGFSLLMFGGTIWALLSQRSTEQVNRRIFTVACLLLLFSTAHFTINIIRTVQGLILFRNTFPGGPIGYFSDPSQWTFVSKNYVYAIQTLLGDGVVLYRCYVAWESKRVMILPVLLWCVVGVTGIASPSSELKATQQEVFGGSPSLWIKSFWASTLVTNLLTTLLLAYRIWNVDRKATALHGRRESQLRPILRVVMDAGLIYSTTLFVALICFVSRSNIQYLILDMITPIISITFYMIIIRVGLAHHARQSIRFSLGHTDTANGDPRNRPQIHSLSVQSNADSEPRSPMSVMTYADGDTGRQCKVVFERVGEAV